MKELDNMIKAIQQDQHQGGSAVLAYQALYPSQERDLRDAGFQMGEPELEQACQAAIDAQKRLEFYTDDTGALLDPPLKYRIV